MLRTDHLIPAKPEFMQSFPLNDHNHQTTLRSSSFLSVLKRFDYTCYESHNISNVLNLIDIWRFLYPDAKRFTWRRRKPDIHCRLDFFFLTSSSLITAITNADILLGFKSDNSLISIHLANNANPRARGFGN